MPKWISRPLGFTIEILAGIPSVVIGLWGILTFGPWLAKHVYPVIANNMPDVPVLRYFRSPVGTGEGLLSAGIVLALMIVPIIASTTRDLFLQVPPLPKEGASALGMTDWEVANKVTLPWVRSGIIGATVLGLGRALGETIAIAMIGGRVPADPTHRLPALHHGGGHHPPTARRRADRRHRLRRGHAGGAGAGARGHLRRRQPGRSPHRQPHGPRPRADRRRLMTSLAAAPTTRRRRVRSGTWRALTYLALVLIMAPAAWLLIGVVARAWSHWQWDVLWTKLTPTGGGLRDQILGTLILMLGTFIVAGTIGVLAGIHLAELARPNKRSGKLSGPLRTASDILSGFPSIVLGYVGYTAFVIGLHWGFSLIAGVIILSIMVIPYIAKTTENSLRQVPTGYREGAEALGMSMGYSLRKVVLKSALPGIVTGLLLALAIAAGETAPLIYTLGFAPYAAALADALAVPLPDLRRLPVLQRARAELPRALLRRGTHLGGDRAAVAGDEPHHRGEDAAPRRGCGCEHLARVAAPATGPGGRAAARGGDRRADLASSRPTSDVRRPCPG